VGMLNFDDATHSLSAALTAWVEKGAVPATIVATKYADDKADHPVMTRPLCTYPQSAKYKGRGDTNDAANFVCVENK
jgi:Tannase and feruloyl esterase